MLENNIVAQNINFGLRLEFRHLPEMGMQSWPKSGLASKRWAGKGTSERERDGSRSASCLLPTGQGKTIALGLRDKMSRTNTFALCQNPRLRARKSLLASFGNHSNHGAVVLMPPET